MGQPTLRQTGEQVDLRVERFDEPAVAALIVAICSASITLGGLVWQLVLYWLQGARLKVQLASLLPR